MSCDWDVYCVDCDEWCGIPDANRQMGLMQKLVECRAAFEVIGAAGFDYMELKIEGEFIDASFFAKHKGHKLRPRNEYDEFDTPCGMKFVCDRGCGEVVCERLEHSDVEHNQSHYHLAQANEKGIKPYHWKEPS